MNRLIKDPQLVFCVFVVVLVFLIDLLFALGITHLSDEMRTMILTAFNTVGFSAAVQYALGSSAGSKTKDEELAKRTPPQPPQP